MQRELKIFGAMLGVFAVAYWLPLSNPNVSGAIEEGFELLQWCGPGHTLACVVPAIFIAGAITTFLSRASVMKHLGPRSPKKVAYSVGVASEHPRDRQGVGLEEDNWVLRARRPDVHVHGIVVRRLRRLTEARKWKGLTS